MAKEIQVFFHMYTITSDHRLGSRRTCTNSIILPSFILSLGTMLHDFVNKLFAKCIILVSKSVAKCFNVIFSNLSHSKMLCNVKCALLFTTKVYVSLRLRVQNRRKKWNFPLNFRTMRKLSELYSGIFQTQSSGCVSGLDHFRNFTKLKILNI